MASYHWDIAMAATLLGVYTFVQLTTYGPHADEHSTVSFTSAVELLMAVRAAVWRSIDIAHVSTPSLLVGGAEGPFGQPLGILGSKKCGAGGWYLPKVGHKIVLH
jgi:hypothetical protein